MKQQLQKMKSAMKNAGNPEKAKRDKAYHKSPFKFYGVSRPQLGEIAVVFYREFEGRDLADLLEVVAALWAGEYHEEKSLAIRIMQKLAARLDTRHLDLLESMLRQCTGWEHTDDLSVHIVGNILLNNSRAESYGKVQSWSRADYMWLRRASVIAHIMPFRKERAELKVFFSTCKQLLEEQDFFIRKAVGWALREASGNYPIEVYDFLKMHNRQVSNLTFKEGSRKLPEDLQADLIAGRN